MMKIDEFLGGEVFVAKVGGETWEEKAAAWGIEMGKSIRPVLTDDYMVKGLLSANTMSVIYGPSNSGKTFFAMDLAYRISAGIYWHGRRVKRSSVLYLATEGGNGVANRVVALRDAHGEGEHFFIRRKPLDLLANDNDANLIVDIVNGIKEHTGIPGSLVVIDTLSRAIAGGDENGAQDITSVIKRCDIIREKTGAHIMLIHHTGKDTSRGARGHSSLRAAVDTEIEIVEAEEGQEIRKAVVRKQRDYENGKEYEFTLKVVDLGVDPENDKITTCIATQVSDAAYAMISPNDLSAILAVVQEGPGDGEKYTHQKNNKDDRRWLGHILMNSMGYNDGEAQALINYMLRHRLIENGEYKSPSQKKQRLGLFVTNK